MSLERELLQRIFNHVENLPPRIHYAIVQLLTQPEHIPDVGNMVEQEPVAWVWEEFDSDNKEWYLVADTGDKPEEEYCGIIRRNIKPLYTSPPKREPLSDEAVDELLMGGFSTHLMDLVRMIEKARGIGK